MNKIKIAIQGELGAYSHIAANSLFKDAEIKTCASFEEAFKQAYEDENFKIIIPIENSLAGRVADIHYLFPKYKLQIHGEYFLNVEHNLLCKPDATIKDIKFVRSHAQAIGQCQKIIKKNKFQPIISADTAGSAKDLAEGNDKTIAAIASELSAKTYKLKFGHRGCNHPVKNLSSKAIEITSQNHGFAVDQNNLSKELSITHTSLNDNTIEGIECINYPAFSVQYHPESSPGPHDSRYLFKQFINMMKKYKNVKKN